MSHTHVVKQQPYWWWLYLRLCVYLAAYNGHHTTSISTVMVKCHWLFKCLSLLAAATSAWLAIQWQPTNYIRSKIWSDELCRFQFQNTAQTGVETLYRSAACSDLLWCHRVSKAMTTFLAAQRRRLPNMHRNCSELETTLNPGSSETLTNPKGIVTSSYVYATKMITIP